MVDEFSRFARMPEPQTSDENVAEIVRDAVLLQEAAETGLRHRLDGADARLIARCDRGLMSQALTNLLKNAAEAVQARLAQESDGASDDRPGEIRTRLRRENGCIVIEIADNGVGLPQTDRARLTEPYVTTRARGTGLGLAIVKKIVEQHGGALTLTDAEPFAEGAPPGALARLSLPLSPANAEQTDLPRIA